MRDVCGLGAVAVVGGSVSMVICVGLAALTAEDGVVFALEDNVVVVGSRLVEEVGLGLVDACGVAAALWADEVKAALVVEVLGFSAVKPN